MQILAFAASNSSKSINRKLIDYAASLLESGQIEGVRAADAVVEKIDLADYEMPIYSIDREEADGIPAAAHDFYRKAGLADALLISFAEHNGSYTVAFKNVLDWASRIDMRVYHDKPIVMLSASPGGGGAAFVLQAAAGLARYFGNEVLASVSIPRFEENFDAPDEIAPVGKLIDPDLDAELRAALATLAGVAAS